MNFPLLLPQQVVQLTDTPAVTSWSCFGDFKISSLNETIPVKLPITLEIRGNSVVIRGENEGSILAGFLCDYHIKFEVLRSLGENPLPLGRPLGVAFRYDNQSEQPSLREANGAASMKEHLLNFTIRENSEKELQKFVRILEKKYIVQEAFHTSYKAVQRIGKGVTACVYRALRFLDGKEVAIKSFKRSSYFAMDNNNGRIAFQKEFKILTELDHPNLCKFEGVYQTDNSTYVVLELLSMSLFSYVQKYGFPDQIVAKKIIKGLLQGVAYLHAKGIMHRDLKLENIMMKHNSKTDVHPVIVDVGLAEYIDAKEYLYTRCGTPGYVAPEVLRVKNEDKIKTYTEACDIFSLGVICHILLCEKPLFQGADAKQVIKKNTECQINFESPRYSTLVAMDAKNLLERMLDKDPGNRISAEEALNLPYFNIILKQNGTQHSLKNVSSAESIAIEH